MPHQHHSSPHRSSPMRRVIALFGACDDDTDAGASAADRAAYVDAFDWLDECARFTESIQDDDENDDSNGVLRASASSRDVRYALASWDDAIARCVGADDARGDDAGGGTSMKSHAWLSRGEFLNATSSARASMMRENASRGACAHVTSAMSAASRVIDAMDGLAKAPSGERALDVVWFTPARDAKKDEDEDETSFDDVSQWSKVSMAMYGVFRRALELGPHVRVRVVTCGTGSVPRSARRVASTTGASTTSLDDDEVVDFGVRWRGALAFASANGKERVEICGLSASRLPRCRRRRDVDDEEDDDGGADIEPPATTSSSSSSLVASALRVVEVVHMRDIPGMYLSATSESLRVNADDGVGMLTTSAAFATRDAFFSAWRSACASAPTWGDAPAFVVQSQLALNTSLPHDAFRRRPVVYRDIVGEHASPMLLYPVKKTRDDASAVEFHLRAFTALPELLQKLSTSAGGVSSRTAKRHFSALDNLGTIARQDALNEAEQGLLILSERPLVKGHAYGDNDDKGDDDKDNHVVDDDDEHNLPGITPCDEAFSPDLTVKKSKVADLVDLATADAPERGRYARQSSEYVRRWERSREANTFSKATLDVRNTNDVVSSQASVLGFDEIVDALMERATSTSKKRDAYRRGDDDSNNGNVEGFLTETFTSCIDDALATLDHNTTTHQKISMEAAQTTQTTQTTRAERREARRREIEEKRENMLRSLGVDPSKSHYCYGDDDENDARAAAALAPTPTTSVIVSSCPSCACELAPIPGMNNCYRCGSSLF